MFNSELKRKLVDAIAEAQYSRNEHERYMRMLDEEKKRVIEDKRRVQMEHEMELRRIDLERGFEARERELNNKFFKDEEVKKLNEQLSNKTLKLAVAEKEVQMLTEIINIEGDVVDVKEIMEKIIQKLPEINLSTLQLTASAPKNA